MTPSFAESLIFREDFRQVKPHLPVSTNDLTMSPFLNLSRHGEGADKYKLSFHPEKPNDPHYVWNGQTEGKTVLAFQFAQALDLSAADSVIKLNTRNSGASRLHIALKTPQGWLVSQDGIKNTDAWKEHSMKLNKVSWLKLKLDTVEFEEKLSKITLSEVTGVAFVNPIKPNKSQNCSRLDWFSLHSSSAKIQPKHQIKAAPFWEESQPFLRSALVFRENKKINRTRRGVILRLGHQSYACFDPDLMRYAALWKASENTSPISLDSMAGTSYPDRKTKSNNPPQLQGTIISSTPELAGVGLGDSLLGDPREGISNSSGDKLGRIPREMAQWIGVSIKGNHPVLHYKIGKTKIQDSMVALDEKTIERTIVVAPSKETISISVGSKNSSFAQLSVSNAPQTKLIPNAKSADLLELKPYDKERTISLIHFNEKIPEQTEKIKLTKNPDTLAKRMEITSLHALKTYPLKVRNLLVPHDNTLKRPIRTTDISFLSNGNAIITTLDGDVWRVEDIEKETAKWSRVAGGLYESMSLKISDKDEIFILGRDQVTELIDTNNNGIFDFYKCASDAFIQTLHTRDFSTSLILDSKGDFIISKGGIRKITVKNEDENSFHRGAILQLPFDGGEAVVLADGLRIPFIGKDTKGHIFASDQQGHFTPSTPIYKLDNSVPSYSFTPTNHRNKAITQPSFWFPHASNRSAANFSILSKQRFPDFGEQLVNLSWNGRLFALAGMEGTQAHPFSVRLPIQLDYPIINAATNPKNGKLYGVGLGISGYKPTTDQLIGLCELEQVSPIPNPSDMKVTKNEITLTYTKPIDPEVKLLLAATEIRAWNIKRTQKYGSGHFRWDGSPGEHKVDYKYSISEDRKSITYLTPDLFKSSILDLSIPVQYKDKVFSLEIVTKATHLNKPNKQELAQISKKQTKPKLRKGNAKKGELIFKKYACATCHSVTNEKLNGPPLNSISKRREEKFIRESILEPEKVVTKGYEASMPSFQGVISDQDLEDVVAYLKTLK